MLFVARVDSSGLHEASSAKPNYCFDRTQTQSADIGLARAPCFLLVRPASSPLTVEKKGGIKFVGWANTRKISTVCPLLVHCS